MADALRIESKAVYPEAPVAVIEVERVIPEQVSSVAAGIQAVLRDAYMRAFEKPNGPLPGGTIRTHRFDPQVASRVTNQEERMRRYMDAGSSYWVARFVGAEVLVGVAKTTPSRPRFRPWQSNCFLNDVDARVPKQGVGTALIYTALGDYRPHSKVILDAFNGNDPANKWFADLSFRRKGRLEEPFEVGPYQISQFRMQAEAVADVQQALVFGKHNGWLLKRVVE